MPGPRGWPHNSMHVTMRAQGDPMGQVAIPVAEIDDTEAVEEAVALCEERRRGAAQPEGICRAHAAAV